MTDIDLTEPILVLSRNLKLRAVQHSDAPSLSKHGDNKKIARNMSTVWPEPYTIDAGHEWITSIRNKKEWKSILHGGSDDKEVDEATKLPTAWTITMDDEIIGTIGVMFGSGTEIKVATFGYWIAEPYWGKGIASEVAGAFVQWIWKTYPNIVRIQADAYAWNPASAKVLQKAGLEPEGRHKARIVRHGQVTDLLLFGAVREGVERVLV